MSLVISNNVSALNAQNNLTRSSNNLNRSIERLSSGFKVNRGADGPAALVISEQQRAQISGLRAAIDNSEKAVSVVQTAEGALSEINTLLVKIRSLAIDSANTGVNDADALAANQAEIDNAIDTINRIASNTQFGTKKLLDGTAGISGVTSDTNVSFLGATSSTAEGSYTVNITTAAERAEVIGTSSQTGTLTNDETITINGVNITLTQGLDRAGVQARINEFSGQTGVVAEDDDTTGSTTRLRTTEFGDQATISVISNQSGAGSAGFTTSVENASGTDIAGTFGGVAGSANGDGNVLTGINGSSVGIQIQVAEDSSDLQQSESGALGSVTIDNNQLTFQIGANAGQTVDIAINSVSPLSLGLGVNDNQFTNLNDINVESSEGAQDTLGIVDAAIDEITNIRGTLGAFQSNTLESTANNLRTTLENTVSAESVIRDTDFAEEISTFTNSQILVQAGTSVLSNANQTSQLVLSLLQ